MLCPPGHIVLVLESQLSVIQKVQVCRFRLKKIRDKLVNIDVNGGYRKAPSNKTPDLLRVYLGIRRYER